jgi:hypothetical protein
MRRTTPKKQRGESPLGGSRDDPLQKTLPKASENEAYTIEKFIPEGSLNLSEEKKHNTK